MNWSLLDIVEALGTAVYGPVADDAQLAETSVVHVAIDTRLVRPGSVFVALLGANTHGIEHAEAAFRAGAVAVLAGTDMEIEDERWNQLLAAASEHGPVLVATDCDGQTMLGRVARAWRRRNRWRVVGITGSSGKTGTKDILRALLERARVNVVASHANWNNEIGVPLTLLAAGSDVDVVICEMGMRGPGQIAWLCDVADPDIGIVTTAGTAHLELLGSRDAIVAAKAELLAGTWRGGVGIFPGVQDELVEAAARVPDRLLPFGSGEAEADDSAVLVTSVVRAEHGITGTLDLMGEERPFALPVHGVHHARNLAAAAAALVSLTGSASLLPTDALMIEGDPADVFTSGRGDRHVLAAGGTVIDDAYNANPESVTAALDELAAATTSGRRVAVLGRMAELGSTSRRLHTSVGAYAAARDQIDDLVVIGDSADADALADGWKRTRSKSKVHRYRSVDEALSAVGEWSNAQDTVLVKASNSSGLGLFAMALAHHHGLQGDDA